MARTDAMRATQYVCLIMVGAIATVCANTTVELWGAGLLSRSMVDVSVVLSTGPSNGMERQVWVMVDRQDKGTNAAAWAIRKPVAVTARRRALCGTVDMQTNCVDLACRVLVTEVGREYWCGTPVILGDDRQDLMAMPGPWLAEFRREYAQAKAAGKSPGALMDLHEFLFAGRGWPVTWKTWMRRYNGVVLDTPVVFDMREPVPEDRTNTVNMVKWFWHQVYRKDTNALAEAADVSGRKFVALFGEEIRLANGVRTNGWDLFNGGECTSVKILFGGRYRFDGMTLYCIVSRRQHPTEHSKHKVFVEPLLLVESGHRLWVTGQDDGSFAGGAFLDGGYKNHRATFEELEGMKDASEMPPHFFTP